MRGSIGRTIVGAVDFGVEVNETADDGEGHAHELMSVDRRSVEVLEERAQLVVFRHEP